MLPTRECSAAAQLALATIHTLLTRAHNALVAALVVEFLAPVPLVPAHHAPERHVLALRAQVAQVRAHVPAASVSVQAVQVAQVPAAVNVQVELVAVHAQVAHPEATLVLTVRQAAVAVAAPVEVPLVPSVAVAARARHASRSGRSGQSSN